MSTTAAPATPAVTEPRASGFDRLIAAGTTVALVAVLAVFAAAMVFPALTGKTPMTILTGSMQPSLPPGHIVIFSPVDPSALVPGDVVAYQPDTYVTHGMPITHRVIEVDTNGSIVVQGDANPVPDKPLRPEQVLGKMDYYIPYAGYLKVVAYQFGLGAILGPLSMVLFGYWLWLAIRSTFSWKPKAKTGTARLEHLGGDKSVDRSCDC